MRTFRPSYTVARPQGAKVLDRVGGRWVRFKNARGQEVEGKLSKSGKRVRFETKCWYCEFEDYLGVLRRVKLVTDETASQRMAGTLQDLLNAKSSGMGIGRDLQRRLEGLPVPIRKDLAAWGLLGEKALAATKPITELAAAYEASLRARERSARHVTKTIGDVLLVCSACKFVFFSDIEAGRVETYLKKRREDGISYRRSNAILMALKTFVNWLIENEYVSKSPIESLKFLNVKEDRRLVRRALEVDELRRLLTVTAASGERWGLTGHERYLVYRLTIEAGLRRGDLLALKVSALNWDSLCIELSAADEKSGQGSTIPLRLDTAAELRAYVANKVPTAKVFEGLTHRTAEMLRDDLSEAGIPYIDASGRRFDFHALRAECGTLLAEAGVPTKTAQVILRHSDINLTANVYTHVLRGREAQAVASLPDWSPQVQVAVKTGTDNQATSSGEISPKSELLRKSCFFADESRTGTNADERPGVPESRFSADNEVPRPDLKSPARKGVRVQIPSRPLGRSGDFGALATDEPYFGRIKFLAGWAAPPVQA